MNGGSFRKFAASIEGVKIGSSVLSSEWTVDGVLLQLKVDGCPIDKEKCRVVGWPGDHFRVQIDDRPEIYFDNEGDSLSIETSGIRYVCPTCRHVMHDGHPCAARVESEDHPLDSPESCGCEVEDSLGRAVKILRTVSKANSARQQGTVFGYEATATLRADEVDALLKKLDNIG